MGNPSYKAKSIWVSNKIGYLQLSHSQSAKPELGKWVPINNNK